MKNTFKGFLRPGLYILVNGSLVVKLKLLFSDVRIRTLVKALLKNKVSLLWVKKHNFGIKIIGDKILYRKEDGSLMVFDTNQKKVFRKYPDEKSIKLLKEGYCTLQKLFEVNSLHFFNELFTEESLIDGGVLRHVPEALQVDIFESILEKYFEGLASAGAPRFQARISSKQFFEKLASTNYPNEMQALLRKHEKLVSEVLNSLDWSWCHGDLTPDNVIVKASNYKVIDLERCEVMPLLYDVYNLAHNFVMMSGNITPMRRLIKGDYEKHFNVINENIFSFQKKREIVVLVMLVLKATVAWDVYKTKNIALMHKRWSVIEGELSL